MSVSKMKNVPEVLISSAVFKVHTFHDEKGRARLRIEVLGNSNNEMEFVNLFSSEVRELKEALSLIKFE